MIAYGIAYKVKEKPGGNSYGKLFDTVIDAKNLTSAKRKLARRHGYKNENVIQCERINIVGYF